MFVCFVGVFVVLLFRGRRGGKGANAPVDGLLLVLTRQPSLDTEYAIFGVGTFLTAVRQVLLTLTGTAGKSLDGYPSRPLDT